MDSLLLRYRPSSYKHHFINGYLSKLKEKYLSQPATSPVSSSPEPQITICTTFFLEEQLLSIRTVESDIIEERLATPTISKAGNKIVLVPVKSSVEGTWNLYILATGGLLMSSPRFRKLVFKGKENWAIIGIGPRSEDQLRAVSRLLFAAGSKDRMVYQTCIQDTDGLYGRYMSQQILKKRLEAVHLEWEREEWACVWKVIGLVDAIMRRPVETLEGVMMVRSEMEVVKP